MYVYVCTYIHSIATYGSFRIANTVACNVNGPRSNDLHKLSDTQSTLMYHSVV